MELYKIGSLFVIAVILQADAFEFGSDENGAVQIQHNRALADTSKSFTALKAVYDEAKTTLGKLQTCGLGTHLEMFQLVALKLSDMQACINATRVVPDFEDSGLMFYNIVKFVLQTVVQLMKTIFSCYRQPGIFKILNCTVTEIQDSGSNFNEALTETIHLIEKVQNDTDSFIFYLKQCFHHKNSTQFLSEMNTLINEC